MFAFRLWDQTQSEIARLRATVSARKPLYYGVFDGKLISPPIESLLKIRRQN
jgi:hypothetical protein